MDQNNHEDGQKPLDDEHKKKSVRKRPSRARKSAADAKPSPPTRKRDASQQHTDEPADDGPDLSSPPRTPDELHAWIAKWLKIIVPRRAVLSGHSAPFAYLAHTFFEGRAGFDAGAAGTPRQAPSPAARAPSPSPGPASHTAGTVAQHSTPVDCVVWANRGGGKTFLGALATLLDMLFKPGIEVRILGGSMEQSKRMHAHLRRFIDARTSPWLARLVSGAITQTRVRFKNGSCVELLAQSQTSVRGTRVHKLRCDEVDLFDPEVWEAAQLTTRSGTCGAWHVVGSVECLSTMHRPHGVMHAIVQDAREGARTLFRWGVVDVLEVCGDEHACRATDAAPGAHAEHAHADCPLLDECAGSAKVRAEGGHISVRDALALKRRVAIATWDAEMLCKRPTRTDAVVPEFDPARHVVDALPFGPGDEGLTWIAGMDFGIRAPTVVLWAALDTSNVLWVVDERVEQGVVLEEHIRAIRAGLSREGTQAWPSAAWIGADPAGNSVNDQTGSSSVEVMRRSGLTVKTRRLTIHEGLQLVRARLAPADASEPRLRIHARCTRLIESLERYHYPQGNPESETPEKGDGFDHCVDALRYILHNLDRPYKTTSANYLHGR